MNALEFLKSLNSTTDKINRSINPLKLNEWLPKINTGIAFNELMKGMSYHNNFIHNDLLELSKRVSWNYDFNKTVMSQLNNSMAMNINNTIFNKINSVGYWGNIAKLSLINGSQIFIDDDELFVSDIIENNIDVINENIQNIENNPIEVKSQIGYLPELPPLYKDMTVREYLEFVAELKYKKCDKKAYANEVMEKTNITLVENKIIKK